MRCAKVYWKQLNEYQELKGSYCVHTRRVANYIKVKSHDNRIALSYGYNALEPVPDLALKVEKLRPLSFIQNTTFRKKGPRAEFGLNVMQ